MTTATIAFKKPSPISIAVLIIVAIAAALIGASGFYTDWLWFDQLGFANVLLTQVAAQAGLFAVAAVSMALTTWLSLKLAYRNRPIYVQSVTGNDVFGVYRQLVDSLRRLVMIAVPIVLGVLSGVASVTQWKTVLLFLNRTATGQTDAQFNLDVSFYLFELPFYTAAIGFISAVLLISLLLAAGVHLVYGNIKFTGRSGILSKAARVQIGITAGLYFVAQAVSLWLDQYSTMTSDAGLFTGATYSDVNASIPGFQILAMVSFFVAILFLIAAVIGRWRLPLIGTALMVVSSLVLGALYPWLVQTFQVVPNERTLEAAYIDRNIKATRAAYGLDQIEAVEYQAKTTAEAGALRADAETTANIRIIDPALVSSAFRQLEQVQQYYNFTNHLDVDRYTINGKSQDTVIAVRELNQSGLGDSQSWYNNTIVYTHGYGVVAAFGNQSSSDGQPVFLQSGIPTKGSLGDYEPRIYFGEQSPAYSIVGAPAGANARELDYPTSSEASAQNYTFSGNGGPKLDNIINRLAYALKFQSEQILLSDAITNSSQILYNRDPRDRVKAVAPYLTLDADTYPAIVDGRVVWIVDGYTTSSQYPYSSAENFSQSIADSSSTDSLVRGSINYIRNSVKATVDAYDGSIKLYAWDETDPILQTWQKVFPSTLLPVSEMSGALLSHVRYPSDLFKIQRTVLGSYHVTDAGSFYSQSDGWMTPNDPTGTISTSTGSALQPPYYLSMKLPAETSTSFSLYSTFIPRSTNESSRNVLRGYLVADSDAGAAAGKVSANYGKLRLLTLPKSVNVPGPGLVQNNFTADSEVSRLLNILRQGSTKVLNGNLLTLPVGGGLLYVQPVYVQSTGETSYPLLKKVLVAFGDKIAFEDTLSGALDSLFGGNAGVETQTPSTPEVPGTTTQVSAALKSALDKARKALADKAAALAAEDWTAYGDAEARLKAAIEAAIAASK